MKHLPRILGCALSVAALSAAAASAAAPETTLFIGGAGGVYFLAEPGELVVEIEKRDLNLRDAPTELRAVLAGPDRVVAGEAVIPDDGKPRGSGTGPSQSCRLSARVERKGVYALIVTVSGDPYSKHAVWGFRSNCPKYLIETSRAHQDARHEEPIVLASPTRPGDVCFLPRDEAFRVEVSGLPKGASPPRMFDANGALIATLDKPSHEFAAKIHRDAVPWRLHFPAAQGVVNMDGLTRWDASDLQPDLGIWTPDASSWFPYLENRWLLTPYSRVIYGPPGGSTEITFQVRNDARGERTIRLSLEFPDGEWPARLSSQSVKLRGKGTATVTVACAVPEAGRTRVCHLRATPENDPGFTTYSTLTVKAGDSPASKPLAMPLTLKPWRHENEQFGLVQEFPTENQVYFDLKNRPFTLAAGGLATLRDGQWITSNPEGAGRPLTSKIAFDRDNHLYVLAKSKGVATLYHSADGGRTFDSCAIPGPEGAFDMEEFTGHNTPDGPPPILRFTRTAKDPKLFWRALHDLELFLPRRENGRLVMGDPILITKQCIGLSSHSGIPSSLVSRGGKVHIAWGEATDPEAKVPGVPAYVATYDRATKQLTRPALVGHGAPANDIHNSPSITMDGEGYLHVLCGTHGHPFPYARSLKPDDASGGWTEAVLTSEDLDQTYIGMVCGPDNSLHSVFRLWRRGMEPFPASLYAALTYQRKRPGPPWEPPRILIVPPLSEYSVYYHRLTIDRKGRLFLSYDPWSTFWFYRNDHPGRRRALMTSPDGGETWKLVRTEDFQ